jgi:hypothetical protein
MRNHRIAVLVLLIAVAAWLQGCATQQVDWSRVHAITVEVDQTAAVWEQVLEPADAKVIRDVREAGQPVMLAIAARAADPDAPDPTTDLQLWVAMAGDVIRYWPHERQRRIALATWSTARMALTLSGVPLTADPEGGG